MAKLDDLIQLGFEPITEWVLVGDKIRLRSLEWREHGGWLYAFCVNGEAQYIGLTNRVLRSRMDNYRDLNHSQTTRIRTLILDQLQAGNAVAIYGCKQPDADVMAAEEARLRALYRPSWNRV